MGRGVEMAVIVGKSTDGQGEGSRGRLKFGQFFISI